MNKVLINGRLVRDPDIRYADKVDNYGQTTEKFCVAKFTLAVNRDFKKDETDFISCTALGKNGQFAEKYLKKGTKIIIEGRWQTGSYENKEGQKVYTNDCVVDRFEFAESKKENNDDGFLPVPDKMVEELPFN